MITYAAISLPGAREYNEDYIKVYEDGDTWIFALADGLGGCGSGSLASRTAVESVFDEQQDYDSESFFESAFSAAQQAVCREQETDPQAGMMSTTMVVLRLQQRQGHAQWAHIGDSRLYRFHGWFLREQTLDHSVPQMLVNMGQISQKQIRRHADRNRLLTAIGRPWDQIKYEVSEERSLAGRDAFLLCTDGFWENITEREMCRCLIRSRSSQEWLDRMTEIVQRHGDEKTMDNYSAICINI